MNYEDVLFIGGPKDGERGSVLEGVREVVVNFPHPVRDFLIAAPNETFTQVRAIYRREQMRSSHGLDTAVFVYGDIDAMEALINGYRPTPK